MNTKSESFKDQLKKKGYKWTKQREAILNAFKQGNNPLLTAQELFDQVLRLIPSTNFSTVYRNLEMMVQENIVTKVNIGGQAARYELKNKGHHHHLICQKCGKVQCTDFCPFAQMPDQDGFVPVEHNFEVYGICKDCLKSDNKNK
ncbi:MAG: transcriptional repressor [Xylanivirga thermophila]|jgi:Fe2+ or Zn2+ uptake regulation protein|uniref:Fur family transcriptional regulator n=1 Tax=Xylanivirga thermophila TaxID=2496273 RepID=UPI00101C407C|nr:Fur family transcriptional regulator [Xylanivirga thermophila]